MLLYSNKNILFLGINISKELDMKNKGFTLIETIIGATVGLALIGSASYGVNIYQERKDLQSRVDTTANQIVSFAEASYAYASSVGGLNKGTITIQDLQNADVISETFSAMTPYGQELKSFVIDNPSEDFYDILVTTTGEPDTNFIQRSGRSEGAFESIQQNIYHEIRRASLDIDQREFYAGMIENKRFNSEGNIHTRNVTSFNADVDEKTMQPAFLLVAPEKIPDNESQIQAIWAEPKIDIPANNLSTANLMVGLRSQDGQPLTNRQVEWSSNRGTLSSARTSSNADGVASVKLRHDKEESATITAKFNGTQKSISVEFVGADVTSIIASPKSNVNADGSMCSTINVTIGYPDGTPAINESIQWSTTLGNYYGKSSSTNSAGKGTGCLRSSSEGNANARVLIPRFNNDDTISIQFIGPRIQSSNISASPSSNLRNDGSHYSTITVKATYPDGSPASGTNIRWTTSRGNLSSGSTTTNSRGETSVRITSTTAGNATIRAMVPSNQSVTTTVGFKAPVLYSITRNKSEIEADNSDRATLMAYVRYMPENVPAKGGHAVHWSVHRGILDHGATGTNASGIAANTVRSNNEGNVTITASYGGVNKSISLTAKDNNKICKNDGRWYIFSIAATKGAYIWSAPAGTMMSRIHTYCPPGNDCAHFGDIGIMQCKADESGWIQASSARLWNLERNFSVWYQHFGNYGYQLVNDFKGCQPIEIAFGTCKL
jgi:Tfp pilus assembly protein PilE